MGELIVKYGNEVNRAARRLTTSELRILFVAIAKNFQVKDRCLECRVSAQELISLGSDPSTAYADLRQAVETLFDRYIVFTEKDASDNALIERKIRWVQDIGYVKGSGEVVVTLSQKLLPFLHDFRKGFTLLKLQEIRGLTAYAAILYTMLCQYRDTRWVKIDVQELRSILEIGDRLKLYGDSKRFAIKSSIKQINNSQNTVFNVRFEEIKAGRKVVAIKFILEDKPRLIALKALEKADPHPVIKITDKQARYFASEAIARDCDMVMQVLRNENILPVSVFRTFYTNQIAIDWLAPQLKKPEVLANKNVQKMLRSFGFSF